MTNEKRSDPWSDLINRPDKWPANTEIDFGGGLYGYRAMGTITTATNVYKQIAIYDIGIENIVDCGGHWEDDAGYAFPLNMHDDGSGTISYAFTYNGIYYFWSKRHSSPRTNAPYDIWVKYTK